MSIFTLSRFLFGYGFRRPGRINRYEGAVLLTAYVTGTAYLLYTVFWRREHVRDRAAARRIFKS